MAKKLKTPEKRESAKTSSRVDSPKGDTIRRSPIRHAHSINSSVNPFSTLVDTVDDVVAVYAPIGAGPRKLVVAARGTTSTALWSSPALVPHHDPNLPTNGVWQFDFVADPPPGFAFPVQVPIAAAGSFTTPTWQPPVTKVQVLATHGSITVDIIEKPLIDQASLIPSGNPPVVWSEEITSFDDSFQPTGHCKGFHLRMKKLHHVLTLVVTGPDKNKIIACVQQVAAAGLIAAVASLYASGGAALSIDITALLDALKDCLGDLYSPNVVDSSYWEYYCT